MEIFHKTSKLSKDDSASPEEDELYTILYDNFPDVNHFTVAQNLPDVTKKKTRNDNVELSLELEITDSLKEIIASPETSDSALLDVTIIRPTQLEDVQGLAINTTKQSLRGSEVRSFLASIEREKQNKKKLIDQCKHMSFESQFSENPSRSCLEVKSEEQKTCLKKQLLNLRRRAPENKLKKLVTKCLSPREKSPPSDVPGKQVSANNSFNCLTGEPNLLLKPIERLKPYINLNTTDNNTAYALIGADNCKARGNVSTASEETGSDEFLFYKDEVTNIIEEAGKNPAEQQIFATANNFDKLRAMLACQKKNNDGSESENDKPCPCQHCGMVGLLIDSQKRPIIATSHEKIFSDTTWPRRDNLSTNEENNSSKSSSKTRKVVDLRTRPGKNKNSQNFCVISDLSNRVTILEDRIEQQESKAVGMDYFKRVITRLWFQLTARSQQTCKVKHLSGVNTIKNRSTQYHSQVYEHFKTHNHSRLLHPTYTTAANVISDKNDCVNPLIMQHNGILEIETPPQNRAEIEKSDYNTDSECKILGTANDSDQSEKVMKTTAETTASVTQKTESTESLLRWGKEIIRPGFDLKSEILSLIDARVHTFKTDKPVETQKSKEYLQKVEETVSGISSEPTKVTHDEKPIISGTVQCLFVNPFNRNTSPKSGVSERSRFNTDNSVTNKKILNIVSEKKVEAKKNIPTKENVTRRHPFNIKSALDDSTFKNNIRAQKQATTIVRQQQEMLKIPPQLETAVRKENLALHKVPSVIRQANYLNERSQINTKKSGIPIRIHSNSETPPTPKQNETKKSAIPKIITPPRTDATSSTPFYTCNNTRVFKNLLDNKTQKQMQITEPKITENMDSGKNVTNKINHDSCEKSVKSQGCTTSFYLDYMSNSNVMKQQNPLVNQKDLKVTYVSPKVEQWPEESCASIEFKISREKPRQSERENYAKETTNQYFSPSKGKEKQKLDSRNPSPGVLKHIANSKDVDKRKLWHSILTQAKTHIKSNRDKITVQIPNDMSRKEGGVTELELTLADIQGLILKAPSLLPKKSKSWSSSSQTSTDCSTERKPTNAQQHLGTPPNTEGEWDQKRKKKNP